ncbi:GNAT family protein [Leifsonia lichenia]
MLVLRPFDSTDFPLLRSWAPTSADVYLFAGSARLWPLTDATMTDWLTATDTTAYTAELDAHPRVPVGHIELVSTGRATARIARVLLDPAQRGRGLGRHLVVSAMDAARTAGIHRLALNVVDGNAAAIATYRSLGFVERGPHPEHPDMTVMETRLD